MSRKEKADALSPGYLLPEEAYVQLEQLRDELLLMSHMVTAVTQEEEDKPMEIRRSMLGQLLENYGFRIDQVLDLTEWIKQHFRIRSKPH
jgi:hypothetical protein